MPSTNLHLDIPSNLVHAGFFCLFFSSDKVRCVSTKVAERLVAICGTRFLYRFLLRFLLLFLFKDYFPSLSQHPHPCSSCSVFCPLSCSYLVPPHQRCKLPTSSAGQFSVLLQRISSVSPRFTPSIFPNLSPAAFSVCFVPSSSIVSELVVRVYSLHSSPLKSTPPLYRLLLTTLHRHPRNRLRASASSTPFACPIRSSPKNPHSRDNG